MRIGHGLYPNEWVGSTFDIDFHKYYEEGYRGIIFDIDNTLVPHGKMGDDRLVEFINGLKDIGFKLILVSNNSKERNERFAEPLGIPFIFRAGKPAVKGYYAACETLELKPEQCICIGDQLYTDILGGNRSGMHTILVNPIDPAEEIQIILKRKIEKPILFFYKRKLKKLGISYPDHRLPEGKARIVNNFGEKGHNRLGEKSNIPKRKFKRNKSRLIRIRIHKPAILKDKLPNVRRISFRRFKFPPRKNRHYTNITERF